MSNHHARGHPNYLAIYIMKKLQKVKLVVKGCMGRTSSSIGGPQLRQKKWGHLKSPWPYMPKHATTTQGCINDMQDSENKTRDINPEDEATLITSADDVNHP